MCTVVGVPLFSAGPVLAVGMPAIYAIAYAAAQRTVRRLRLGRPIEPSLN